jgi:hypothetical protein
MRAQHCGLGFDLDQSTAEKDGAAPLNSGMVELMLQCTSTALQNLQRN